MRRLAALVFLLPALALGQSKVGTQTVGPATPSAKGTVQLSGDLAGTAASPQVTGPTHLSGALPSAVDASAAKVTATGSSTARSHAARAADTFNAKDFGAVGDGTTDDTTALQAAITACTAVGGKLYVPAGNYKITSPLSVPASGGCQIEGAPWRYVAGSPVGGSTITNANTTGGHAIVMNGTGNGAVHISRLLVLGNPLSGRGIDATNAYNFDIENVWVQGHGDDGVRLTRCWAAKIHRLVSVHNGYNGLTLVDRANNVIVRDSVLNGNASKGGGTSNLSVQSPFPANPDYNSLGLVIEGNDIEGAGQSPFGGYTVSPPAGAYGVTIQGVDGLIFKGNYLEGAVNYLLYMDNTVSSWEMSGNYFQDGLVDIELAKNGKWHGNVLSAYNVTTTATINAGDGDNVQAWATTLRHGATTSYPNATKERKEDWGTAPPAAGTYSVGDLRWNKSVTPGAPVGWMNVVGGSPGTWVPVGALSKVVTPTYGSTVALDASLGDQFVITPTNGTAFTFAAPTNATARERITIRIVNTFGALGAVTWTGGAGGFRLSAWTQPANSFNRSITFRFDGVSWIEESRTTVDVPN